MYQPNYKRISILINDLVVIDYCKIEKEKFLISNETGVELIRSQMVCKKERKREREIEPELSSIHILIS